MTLETETEIDRGQLVNHMIPHKTFSNLRQWIWGKSRIFIISIAYCLQGGDKRELILIFVAIRTEDVYIFKRF